MTVNTPWRFELVDGRCILHIDSVEMTEEMWDALVRDRTQFMQPVWKARAAIDTAKRAAERAARENLQTITEVIEGETVYVAMRGVPSEAYMAWVGDEDREKARMVTDKGWTYKRPYRVKLNKAKNYFTFLDNDNYTPRLFETPQAAIRAALKAEKKQ